MIRSVSPLKKINSNNNNIINQSISKRSTRVFNKKTSISNESPEIKTSNVDLEDNLNE